MENKDTLGSMRDQCAVEASREASGVELLKRIESLAVRAVDLADRLADQLEGVLQSSLQKESDPSNKLCRSKPAFFSRADNSLDGVEAALVKLQSISARLDL